MQNKTKSQRFIWIDIMLTLLTLAVMNFFYCGVRTVVLGGICVAVSLAAEIISLRLMHRQFTADDLTCISDAFILFLMLPAVIDFRMAGIACIFAAIAAKNILRTRQKLNEILAANTGKPIEVIAVDTERDNYMTAEEAVAYGLIDSVITNR